MYIQKAEIKNIRSIEKFEIEFKNPAGWHVLIGDNGAGKSTIIRSMASTLVGGELSGLRANWNDWLNQLSKSGDIKLTLSADEEVDIPNKDVLNNKDIFFAKVTLDKDELGVVTSITLLKEAHSKDIFLPNLIESTHEKGFFSVAYGPYRRFEGGSSKWDELFRNPSFERLAAHLSVFGEDIALTETINWLKDLKYKSLENDRESERTLENLKQLINSKDFLPNNTKLVSVNSNAVVFMDGNEMFVSVNQLSDGYRSVLSLTFELIRQLVRVYGSELVFKNIEKGEMFIDLPGVVLVDEIDAHLHPTWQTRIGNWFLKYFPKLQFIVTTHSPLVCRAAENGSIWRLKAPGSDEESSEVTGIDRERLIYGDIVDAIEVFGPDLSISEKSVEKQEELVKLSKKKMAGVISRQEEKSLKTLRNTFTTDDSIDL